MRIKLFFLLICAVLLTSLVACSNTKNASFTLTADDFTRETSMTREVVIGVGDTLKVTLPSNASTGYSWQEYPAINNPGVLKQASHKYIEPSSKTPVVGASGTQEWTFKGSAEGGATAIFRYARPWESGLGLYQLNLKVSVRQGGAGQG